MGAAFLKRWFRSDTIAYVSDPSWENHHDVFLHEGITTTTYPYWDKGTKNIRVSDMMRAIEDAPVGSIIVLHACGHNPTGQDLSPLQWEELAHVMLQREHFAYFDSAYQGFVSGDLEEDNR
jgi:aspartate aminotransferase